MCTVLCWPGNNIYFTTFTRSVVLIELHSDFRNRETLLASVKLPCKLLYRILTTFRFLLLAIMVVFTRKTWVKMM